MKNKRIFLILLISQIAFVLSSVVWVFFAFMSVMMFDDPEAASNFWVMTLFIVIWVYPLALLGSVFVSWILYNYRQMKSAVFVSFIPALWILPIVGFLLYANLS